MTLVRGNGGLLVPQGALEAAVARALRQHDDDLRLVPQESDVHGQRVYKVYRYNGSERAADFVCGWWDEHGKPYPLSMNIVELVQLHDRNTVGRLVDEDEANRRLVEERRADARRDSEAIRDEHKPKVERARATFGMSTTKQPRYWRREAAYPKSGVNE